MNSLIKIRLKKSLIGRSRYHRAIVYGLGLKDKIGSMSILKRSKSIEGMISKVKYLISLEEL